MISLPTKEEINKRVERGAVWLDRRAPGWERKIDLQELDLGDCDQCIIGQTFGEYWAGLDTLKPKRSQRAKAILAWSTNRGFAADARGRKVYPLLRKEWTRLIKERFNSGRLSDF